MTRLNNERYFKVSSDISRWKIENRLENWLAHKADHSQFWKKVYVGYYWAFDNKYYKKGCQFIQKEIKRQRKNFQNFANLSDKWLITDMIYSLHRFGVSFEEYFIYRFYDLNSYGRSKYNSLKLQYGYCEQFNAKSVRSICENKGKTFSLLKKYYKRDAILVDSSTTDISLFINNLYLNCQKMGGGKQLIFKPLTGHSGQGIQFMELDEFNPTLVKKLYEEYGPFILEELINQAPELAILHPESINTIRIATIRIGNDINIYGAAIRMGRGRNKVDNAGAGGIYAGIDTETGIIISKGMDNECNEYVRHPDSGIVIPGFIIPLWDSLLETIIGVSDKIDGATLIAWDFALGKNGWCLVEANDIGEAYLLQGPEKKGIKSKVYKLFDKLTSIK